MLAPFSRFSCAARGSVVDQSVPAVRNVDELSPSATRPGRLDADRRADPRPAGAGLVSLGRIDIPRVTAAVRHLMASAEPSRVFSQLAQVCVPAVCDGCTIEIVEEGGHRYRIRQPAESHWRAEELGHDAVVQAEFSSDGAGGPRFSGTVVCTWLGDTGRARRMRRWSGCWWTTPPR